MNVGVLALQGSVVEHLKMIASVNKKYCAMPVKTVEDLAAVDGLIIPGGESTTLRKLMDDFELTTPVRERIVAGMPVWGTCAGLILLATRIEDCAPHLGVLDIDVKRNAYGRQTDSFVAEGDFAGLYINMVFVRAPAITRVGEGVEVLAECGGKPVAVRKGNILATAFHPEMTRDNRVHRYFCGMIDAKDEQ